MCGRDHQRIAHPQFIKIGHDSRIFHSLSLVDRQYDRAATSAQIIGNGLVMWCDSLTPVHNEDHDIGFCNRLLRLFGHFLQNAFLDDRFKTTGVDDEKRTVTHSSFTVMTVTGQTGIIGNQRRP